MVISELLSEFVSRGGIDHYTKVEKESFDFFYNNFLQKLERMEDILMVPQINDGGDLLVRIKPHKTVIERIKKQA